MMPNGIPNHETDHDWIVSLWTINQSMSAQLTDLVGKVDRYGLEQTQIKLDIGKIRSDITALAARLDEHQKDIDSTNKKLDEHSGRFKAIDTRIDVVDNKSKFDISKAAVQFLIYLIGGGGAFTFAMWVYSTFFANP